MNNNQSAAGTPKNALKTTSIIHLALLAGQVLFMIVAYITNKNIKYFDYKDSRNDVFFYIAPLMAITCTVVGGFLFNQQLGKFHQQAAGSGKTLSEKLQAYQSALIVRYALLEGPSLFGIVCFLITGNLFYLLISTCLIITMISLRPSVNAAEAYLQLSYDETQQLR
jgi:hypothetical protein